MIFNLILIGDFIDPPTTITLDGIIEAHNKTPKRICFDSRQTKALRRFSYQDTIGSLNVPFEETFKKIFEDETKLSLRLTRYDKYWCPIKTEGEFVIAQDFLTKYNKTVFLRDRLDLSIALGEHMIDDTNRTKLGELEYLAKYQSCKKSRKKIAELALSFIQNTGLYKETEYICSIPSSDPKKKSFPNKITQIVARDGKLIDVSEGLYWTQKKNSLKELTFEEKLRELENSDLHVNLDSKIKTVILIDDLYQSGMTMQYVAMKLKEAGVRKVYGLAIVKSRRDSDNT